MTEQRKLVANAADLEAPVTIPTAAYLSTD